MYLNVAAVQVHTCFSKTVQEVICINLSFSDLLVRPNKAEVLQLDGGGVLLVWKPVLSSDSVTYCVQYCTEGGFTMKIQQQLPPHSHLMQPRQGRLIHPYKENY